ncbi:hypothetical protein ACS0TY_004660 [Phlomoides rotata]
MNSHKMENFLIYFLLGLLCLNIAESRVSKQIPYSAINCRKHTALLTDFGGKGDGKTSTTAAFKAAITHLSKLASDGRAQLVVPPGKWLTGSFNLTNHFTLYIHKKVVLLASQEESDYPLIDPLPSYGRGRDAASKRFASLIFGTNLTDVVITGGNGTIDGQGESWWKKFKSHQLKNTRPYLIEILYSNQVISDLTLINSPSWHIHPTYCRSCVNTRIRDSYVVSGDDCIAVKSGWDQYGSEMSGGIQDVRANNIYAINSQSGVRIKTALGRGAYVKGIFVRNMNLNTMTDIVGKNVTIAGDILGIHDHPFIGICISDVNVELQAKKKLDDFFVKKKKLSWNCTDVRGVSSRVTPKPCFLFPETQVDCAYPSDVLPIDKVKLKKCYVVV